mgnify:CR=1 FL=1
MSPKPLAYYDTLMVQAELAKALLQPLKLGYEPNGFRRLPPPAAVPSTLLVAVRCRGDTHAQAPRPQPPPHIHIA